jgi:amidase
MLSTSDLPFTALTDIAVAIKDGALSPVTLTETMLARIASVDAELHSYIAVTADEALAQAHRAESEIRSGRYRGPLHGVPIAIKDLFFTKGTPATFGSMAYKDFCADHTATVVERLIAAGAVILGRLALHEGALAEHHPGFGAPPTHPWVEGFWPGGSSSGSGVATAAGLCFGSLGSDTGGSIRFPSATNGLTGLKPTWGRVSRYGVFTLADSLDTVGPMCRSAADVAAMFDVIAGHDDNDATSLRVPVPGYAAALDGVLGARDLRIGIDWSYVSEGVDPELVAALSAALEVFAGIGARIVPITMPPIETAARSQRLIMETECANYHRERYAADASGFGRLRETIERGLNCDPAHVAAAYIEKDRFRGALLGVFETVDVIAAPIMPWVGIRYGELDELCEALPTFGRFCGPYNMAGVPTITFPVGANPIGLPLAMQLIGPHLSEATLFKSAHAFQQATDFHLRRPRIS